ncbi:MAG: hypothetical protein NC179_03815, partial [[Eubacterium] siraeum]|nr:hypothetical protein [[Eubacterium] siraeum]
MCDIFSNHSIATADDTTAAAYFNEGNYFVNNVVQGKQNEYLYFGTKSNAAIKWRVLSKTDTKYSSSGSWLLWADKSFGLYPYQNIANFNNPNYAYWSTSYIRALLNGGNYLNDVTTSTDTTTMPALSQTVADSASWFKTLFNTTEQANMVATGDYQTKDLSFDHNHNIPKLYTTNIVGTGIAQYDPANVNSMNNLATQRSASISVSGTSVIETTSDDYLFLIDYYDINNTEFGFGDIVNGNLVTYANKVDSSWTSSSAGYPSSYDDDSTTDNASITAEYLTGDEFIWLRPAARISTQSFTLVTRPTGYIYITATRYNCDIRPALNLNPNDIYYASAHNQSSIGSTFVNLVADAKPAYKLYFKDTSFSDTKQASFSKTGNSFKVTFTSPNSNANQAVALLSSKTATDNSVTYQANASISGNAATFTIPSGLNINDYNVTVLLTTNNGGFSTETVYDQYTFNSISASYYGYINGADSPDFNGGSSQTLAFGSALYSPSSAEIKSNHKFLGW